MQLFVFWKNRIILIILFLFLKPILANGWETIIATGNAPLRENLVETQQEAVKNALMNAIKTTVNIISPYVPNSVYKNIFEVIKTYSLLEEERDEDSYHVQIEVEINWENLAKRLDSLGIIETNQGEKILLFFLLPEGIDFKTPLLSFWQRFFLLFNFLPIFKENLYKEQVSDYTFQKGIPFLLNFILETKPNEIEGWHLNFNVELIYTIYHETIYKESIEKFTHESDIETLIRTALKYTQDIAYNLAQRLSLWLENHKKREITYFEIIFKDISDYNEIFTLWEKIEKISGIRIYLKEVSAKKTIYTGRYEGTMSELINQLGGLGLVIKGIRGNTIYLSQGG